MSADPEQFAEGPVKSRPHTLLILCGSGPLIAVAGLLKMSTFILLASRDTGEWTDLMLKQGTMFVPKKQLEQAGRKGEDLSKDKYLREHTQRMLDFVAEAVGHWKWEFLAAEMARVGLCLWLAVAGAGALTRHERWRRRFVICNWWNIPYHLVNAVVMSLIIHDAYRGGIDHLRQQMDRPGLGVSAEHQELLNQLENLRIGSVAAMIFVSLIWASYYVWSVRYLNRPQIRACYTDRTEQADDGGHL